MRNGKKFNILDVMRFVLSFLIAFLLPLSVFAEDAIPSAQSQEQTVTLDAKVVQIVLNDEHRQGVDWEAIVSDFHSLQLKKENNPVWSDKRYKLSVGEISNDDFTVLLDALDTVGRFNQKDFLPIILSKNSAKSIDISPDPKGTPTIGLHLTWFTSPAGEVKLKVEPDLGVTFKDSNEPNTVVTLNAKTDVDLKDNTTLVIGSFMNEEEITKTRKFPLLGDLPLLGLVFRKQGRLMQKTETIIFLSMHTGSIIIPEQEQK